MLRFFAKLSLGLCITALGCGRSGQAPQESPEQAAGRVLNLAQNLENQHKKKEAFAAYRQVVRHYPSTTGARKAAERIDQEQRAVMKRSAQQQ